MFTLGLSSKRKLGPTTRTHGDNDEQWYIPYNGPYEEPPPPRTRKARDSWGDPIDDYAVGPVAGDSDVDVGRKIKNGFGVAELMGEGVGGERRDSGLGVLSGGEDEEEAERRELFKRYGGGHDEFKYGSHGVFDAEEVAVGSSKGKRVELHARGHVNTLTGGDEERERGRSLSRGRDRAFSVVSTTSSGALDPGRTSFSSASVVAYPHVYGQATPQRRSTVSSANQPVIQSYVSLNGLSAGGVGESPMPFNSRQGRRQGSRDSTRKSLASIFTFGAKLRSGSPARSIEGGRDGHRERERQPTYTPSKWSSSQKTTPSKPEKSNAHGYGRQVDRTSPTRRDSDSSTSTSAPPTGVGLARASRSYSPFTTTVPGTSGVIPQATNSTPNVVNPTSKKPSGNRISPSKATGALQPSSNHDSLTTDEEDYYNSYYSMLEQGPDDGHAHPYLSRLGAKHRHSPSKSQEVVVSDAKRPKPPSRQNSTSPLAHPYAYQNPHLPATSHPNLELGDTDEFGLTNAGLAPSPPPPPSSAPPSSGFGFSTKHPYSTSYTHHPYVSGSGPKSAPATSPAADLEKPVFTVPTYSVTQPSNTTATQPIHPYAIPERTPSPSGRGVASVGLNLSMSSLGVFGRKLRNSTSTPNLRLSKHVQVVSPTATSISGSSGGSSVGLGGVGSSNTFVDGNTQARHLRVPAVQIQTTQPRPPTSASTSTMRSKDRWLAAETWCDALLFPRPRLKVKAQSGSTSPSPPGDILTFSPPKAASPSSAMDVGVRLRSPSADPFACPTPMMAGVVSSSLVGLPPTPHHFGSGRIVSPPGSPLWPDELYSSENAIAGPSNPRKPREPGIASRVLAHSRSLVDLRSKADDAEGYPSVLPRGVVVEGVTPSKSLRARGKEKVAEQAERPKSFALDDLDLPTPVPSLAHVLAEGQQLDQERQVWQAMATKSLGNKRARSLSRSRAKSMTRKGRAAIMTKSNSTNGALAGNAGSPGPHQGHMEYLAAQACLGNQNIAITPNIEAPPKLAFLEQVTSADTSHGTGTTTVIGSSRGGHSHSNSHATSVAKTITNKSIRSGGLSRSQTHSRSNSKTHPASGQHSRGDSWSRTAAVRVARICGDPGVDLDMDYVGVHSGGSGGIGTERIGGGYGVDDDQAALLGGHHNGLEKALRRDSTRVIKLADPAHLPVDKGIPVSHSLPPPIVLSTTPAQHPYNHYTRKSPSPAFSTSGISESQVGIALGTPPAEEMLQMATKETAAPVSYTISHPYAQGFTSYGYPTSTSVISAGTSSSPTDADRHKDFAGPHPSVINHATAAVVVGTSSNQAPAISNIIARHKLAPHLNLAAHPYAKGDLGSVKNADASKSDLNIRLNGPQRDSYLDNNGLVAQFRSEGSQPHPNKMWAQLSPGVVREVLEGDFQYSPYLPVKGSESGVDGDYIAAGAPDRGIGVEEEPFRRKPGPNQGPERERLLSIHDTVGVAEALVNASRYGLSQDALPPAERFDKNAERDGGRPITLSELPKHSDPISNHTIASSRLDSTIPEESPDLHDSISQMTSGTGSTSPRLRPLGSPNDLDSFQDLFYRPSTLQERRTPKEAALPETPSPANASLAWDVAMKGRRTGSGLSSLARQLSEDMEALALENGRGSSYYAPSQSSSLSYSHSRSHSMGSISHRLPIPLSRKPTHGSLQFVFEEMAPPTSPTSSMNIDVENTVHVFQPSDALPEDVQSSRASSMIEGVDPEEDEDFIANLRLGMVESLATPPIVSSEHRFSYNGETVLDPETGNDDDENDDTIRAGPARVGSPLRQELTNDANPTRRPHPLDSHSRPQVKTHSAQVSSPRTRVLSHTSSLHPGDVAFRASYMTTSDASRMSGLSDFPAPPPISAVTPQHVSYLASYFDDDFKSRDRSTSSSHLQPLPPLPSAAATAGTARSSLTPSFGMGSGAQTPLNHPNVEFGDNQSAAELAKTLSSPSPQP